MDCSEYEDLMLTVVNEGYASPEIKKACEEHRRVCGVCRMKGLEEKVRDVDEEM